MRASKTAESIIGGLFGLEYTGSIFAKTDFLINLEYNNIVYVSSARGGIYLLADHLKPSTIWFPSYLCDVMVVGVRKKYEIRYYSVDYNLQPDLSWLDEIKRGDIVCVIDYFGWPAPFHLKTKSRQAGGIVLEDASQALLTPGIGQGADYLVYSPRKYVGVPDGGLLVSLGNNEFDIDLPVEEAPASWWLTQFRSCLLRYEYDKDGRNSEARSEWYQLYNEAEKLAPHEAYAMSSLSKQILLNCIDYEYVATRRRENYNTLLCNLFDFSMFGDLDKNVVPLGFVCRFPSKAKRNHMRDGLIREKIFPSIHWDISSIVSREFQESHLLSHRILTIPCDQRYGTEDMERIIRVVKKISSYYHAD